jgi:hypothetical protein
MKISSQISTLALITIFSTQVFAADNVAKVIIMRGLVKAKLTDGTIIDVKADQSIPEGATVQTADKSFVKLLFIDKSQMNLGPNSQMVINAFPKKEAGIITLVKGQIRSQVTKDYMEMDDKSKSKLYIKTKTAAMGIRGTDFQVNFNPENMNTSLITFEGKVAMSNFEKSVKDIKIDQSVLERVVSNSSSVFVTAGQVSVVNFNVSEKAMIPTKLGTQQIEALEKNENGVKEIVPGDEAGAQFRNPIPPGTDGAAFSNNKLSTTPDKLDKTNVEGFYNVDTGVYKLPAGSIIDLKTLNIIPPPSNAMFDANTGTYIVPESLGKIDKQTGDYKAPVGLELGADGKFKVIDPDAYAKSQAVKEEPKKEEPKKEERKEDKKDEAKPTDERNPTSVPPTTGTAPKPPEIFNGAAKTFINTFAPPPLNPAGPPPPNGFRDNLTDVAKDILKDNDIAKQTAIDRGIASPKTKVKFIFNAR